MRMNIDLSKPIVCEIDVWKGEAYCIECFSPPKSSLYFYNGYGPFCCKKCFSDFTAIPYDELPNLVMKGVVK